tara:strand:- start:12411 stop:12725 length:315 start_codon:yes stop_codon:yes gene_type:complete
VKTRAPFLLSVPLSLLVAGAARAEGPTVPDLIADWISALESGAQILVWVTSALGIFFTAWSLFGAYNAQEERGRTRELVAALWGGVVTISVVIAGLLTNILVPS